jgi:hypothetical protein
VSTNRPAERDAEPAPPWDPARKPEPPRQSYDRLERPSLSIRVGGEWRRAEVMQRENWPDGRVRLLCWVYLPNDSEGMAWRVRSYWWDRAAMRFFQP